MKIKMLCTSQGLMPMYDEDFENKKKLHIGQEYLCEVRPLRNIKFHRKYFALINCAWAYMNEAREAFFGHNIESFRKTVEIAAGHCDKVYNVTRQEWLDMPKSIAFDKMDDAEFAELYEKVKNVLYTMFLDNVTIDEFEKKLINF